MVPVYGIRFIKACKSDASVEGSKSPYLWAKNTGFYVFFELLTIASKVTKNRWPF